MDSGEINLFIKMIRQEYDFSEEEIESLFHRLLADDREFQKVWKLCKDKIQKRVFGVDELKETLKDLLR